MRIVITFSLVFLMCLPLAAQTTSVVQENIAYSGSMYYFHQRKVARSTTGVLMVAWNSGTGTGSQVYYSTYDKDFETWSPPAAISNAPALGAALQPALAADELGNIHAAWQQRPTASDKYQILYSKFDGVSWTTPKQVSVTASVRGEEGTIDVDSKGYIWVVYNNDGEGNGNEFVYIVNSTDGGSTWSTDATKLSAGGTLGTSIEVGRTALAPGPNGKLVAVWDNSLEGTGTRREVFVNQYDGTSWGTPVMISDTTAVDRDHNRYVAAAVDAQSNIYIFYTLPIVSGDDPRLSHIVMHKKTWDAVWTPEYTVAIDSSVANFLSVSSVIDSQGVMHLAYRRDTPDDTLGLDQIVYRYSKNSGATWSTPVVMSRPRYDGGYVSLANRVRQAFGVDIAWRESQDSLQTDQSVTAALYGNIPYSVITSVAIKAIPFTYETLSNYPNPFNPATTISYDVAVRGMVRLAVYDLLGREIATLVEENREAGHHTIQWKGTDASGKAVASGVYLARLSTASGSRSLNMLLVK